LRQREVPPIGSDADRIFDAILKASAGEKAKIHDAVLILTGIVYLLRMYADGFFDHSPVPHRAGKTLSGIVKPPNEKKCLLCSIQFYAPPAILLNRRKRQIPPGFRASFSCSPAMPHEYTEVRHEQGRAAAYAGSRLNLAVCSSLRHAGKFQIS
jgi:hypothetical protein